jgi:hypothetical protein
MARRWLWNCVTCVISRPIVDSPTRLDLASQDDWDFDQIIVGHGAIVENNGKEVFRTAFRWLLEVIGVNMIEVRLESVGVPCLRLR